MGYRSPEIRTPLTVACETVSGTNLLPGGPLAAAVYATGNEPELWVVGPTLTEALPVDVGQPSLITLPTLTQLGTGVAEAAKAFTVAAAPSLGPTATGAGLAVSTATPYLFVNRGVGGSPGQLLASAYQAQPGSGSTSPSWTTGVSLHGTAESAPALMPETSESDVSAVACGDAAILVACAELDYSAPNCKPGSKTLYLGAFNTGDFSTTTRRWQAAYELTWTLGELQDLTQRKDLSSVGKRASVAVFASGHDASPLLFAAVVFSAATANGAESFALFVPLKLDDQGLPMIDPDRETTWDVYGSAVFTVTCDPCGRLRLYGTDGRSGAITIGTLMTAKAPQAGQAGTGKTLASSWSSVSADVGTLAPTACFFKSPGGTAVYELLVYPTSSTGSTGAKVAVQVATYGYADAVSLTGSAPGAEVVAVTGIIDGPIPVANENLHSDFEADSPDLGSIVYGTKDTKSTTHATESELAVGFKTEGEASSGYGPAWDISFEAGTGTKTERSTQQSFERNVQQPSSVNWDADDPGVVPTMSALGTVGTAAPQITAGLYRFADPDGPRLTGRVDGALEDDGSVSVFGISDNGHLLFLTLGAQAERWLWQNLSVDCDPASPITMAAGAVPAYCAQVLTMANPEPGPHVFTCDQEGNLYDWVHFNDTGWTFQPIVVEQTFGGDPAAVTNADGTVTLYVRDAGGHLLSVTSSAGGWSARDITAELPDQPTVAPQLSASGETVLACDPHGHVLWLSCGSSPAWVDVTLQTKIAPCTGRPAFGATDTEIYAPVKGSAANDGHLVRLFLTPPSTQWRTDDIGSHVQWLDFEGSPDVVVQPDGSTVVYMRANLQHTPATLPKHLYAVTGKGGQWTRDDLSGDAADGVAIAGDPCAIAGTVYAIGTDASLMAFSGSVATDVTSSAGGLMIVDATTPSADQAPKWATFGAALISKDNTTYPVFSVIPGDLTSYTAYSWNKRMGRLAVEDPDLYAGADYVDVVVDKLAQFRFDFTWVKGHTSGEGASVTSGSVDETSFSLDDSFYVGWSWGGIKTPFGLGDEAGGGLDVKFLAGTTFKFRSTGTQSTEDEWGLYLRDGNVGGEDEWGPPPYRDDEYGEWPGCVAEYSFSLYLLPVPDGTLTLPGGKALTPNYWVKELVAGLKTLDPGRFGPADIRPEQIATGGGAFKAMFVVTGYTYIPGLTASAAEGVAGEDVALTGVGFGTVFGQAAEVTLSFEDAQGKSTPLGTVTTDPNWAFGGSAFVAAAHVQVPADAPAGGGIFHATCGALSAQATFAVAAPSGSAAV